MNYDSPKNRALNIPFLPSLFSTMKLLKRFLEYWKDSKFFLTAKNKYIDTYELHAFGSGLIVSMMFYAPDPRIQKLALGLMGTLSMIALGLEEAKEKKHRGNISEAMLDAAIPFRKQIRKEGQYTILGIATPHVAIHLVIFLLSLI